MGMPPRSGTNPGRAFPKRSTSTRVSAPPMPVARGYSDSVVETRNSVRNWSIGMAQYDTRGAVYRNSSGSGNSSPSQFGESGSSDDMLSSSLGSIPEIPAMKNGSSSDMPRPR